MALCLLFYNKKSGLFYKIRSPNKMAFSSKSRPWFTAQLPAPLLIYIYVCIQSREIFMFVRVSRGCRWFSPVDRRRTHGGALCSKSNAKSFVRECLFGNRNF